MKKNNHLIIIGIVTFLIMIGLGFYVFKKYFYINTKDFYEVSSYNLEYKLNYIEKKKEYYEDFYNIKVISNIDPWFLSDKYKFSVLENNDELLKAIDNLDNLLKLFNKEFFDRFNGIDIYFVSSIKFMEDNTDVVGLYLNKDDKYNIVISTNTEDSIKEVLAHELMHLIEDYIKDKEITFIHWNSYNPEGFHYLESYDSNKIYDDTIDNNKDNEAIYFVDGYARSNEQEERARLFEYICLGKSFNNYPKIREKIKYLKTVITINFPELKDIDNFKI